MTGKRSNTSRPARWPRGESRCGATGARARAFVALALAAGLLATPRGARAESLESFLLPGIDIRTADLSVGRWCRYLVTDEAEGMIDSVTVYAAVVGKETVGHTDAYWVEFATAPLGADAGERDVTRVLISSSIRDLSEGDSLYHYVDRLYIKRGTEPVAPADPRDLKRLTLTDPTTDADWLQKGSETVTTPKGTLECERKDLVLEESREVPAGRVKIVQYRKDHFEVWSSSEVPIFGLARCVIERVRETKTLPAVPGIPQAGPRESRVVTAVLDYGDGAEPLITIE